jgi:hypothetical protein
MSSFWPHQQKSVLPTKTRKLLARRSTPVLAGIRAFMSFSGRPLLSAARDFASPHSA